VLCGRTGVAYWVGMHRRPEHFETVTEMTSTILVAVDGTDKDARALAVAADLAQLGDALLVVVRVHNPQADSATHESRSSMLQAMRVAAEVVGLRVPRGLTCEVVDGDDVPNALLARADSVNATAVVMATRAPQAIDRAIHGSVADRIVRTGSRPVVLVPPRADYMGGRDVHLRRGLVPIDGSATALSVIDHLLAFPNARELDLLLLRVVPPDRDHEAARTAEETLITLVERIREKGVTAEPRVVEAGHPAAVIVEAIRQDLIDFIAMSTRGAGGIARTMLGSVATAVVRASEVPVLLVTPTVPIPSTIAARTRDA
jgi:nucleotide-binding universal stress UspA family protein